MWNPYDFSGKRFVVTGAGSGIGKATAVRLSEQGAEVCLLVRSRESGEKTLACLSGKGHSIYVKDLSESCRGGVKPIFDDIVKDGHKIDGLVYCAGIAKILPAALLGKENMDESMTVNFYSFAEMVGLLSKKKYHDKASIVGVSSISVKYPRKCQGTYLATKAAMGVMVASLAQELAEKNIRINTVMPGIVNTPMMATSFENTSAEDREAFLSRAVLGVEEPEDIADVILFLLSDASRMITGREIYADGGHLNF